MQYVVLTKHENEEWEFTESFVNKLYARNVSMMWRLSGLKTVIVETGDAIR